MKEIIIDNLINGNFAFGIFCLITIASGLYVLFAENVLYAALGLMVCFFGVAAMFVFSGSEYVAAAQIMIYIGGILILIIFGIMLSSKKGKKALSIENKNPIFTLILIASLGLSLILMISAIHFDTKQKAPLQHVKNLGFSLMSEHILPLEIVGVLLLMALIGATYISKTDE